jgi:hypothetical protein
LLWALVDLTTTAASAGAAAISEPAATSAAPSTPAANFVVMTLLPKNDFPMT